MVRLIAPEFVNVNADGSYSERAAFLAFIAKPSAVADIREEDRAVLNRDAEALKKFDFLKVTVEGHCDERGTVEYNLALGERRARVELVLREELRRRTRANGHGRLPLEHEQVGRIGQLVVDRHDVDVTDVFHTDVQLGHRRLPGRHHLRARPSRTVGNVTTLIATGIAALLRCVHDELDRGNISAAQLAIGLEGDVIEFHPFGTATEESRFVIFSATKAVKLGGSARGELRFEVLNLTNHVKVRGPITTLGSSTFGVINVQSAFMRLTQVMFRVTF